MAKKPVQHHGETHAPEPQLPGKKGKEFARGKGEPEVDHSRRNFLRVAGAGGLAALLGFGKKARGDERVASAETPNVGGHAEPSIVSAPAHRLYDGGGPDLCGLEASPMTPQQFQQQIAYMFDLTSQFEVFPDSSGKYVTDEFIVKRRSNGTSDRAPFGTLVYFGRNGLDGGDSVAPLTYEPLLEDVVIRVFRFQVSDSAVVKNEVVAIVDPVGVEFLYFNKAQNLYTRALTVYNSFGSSPKIGLEMNEQDGIGYLGVVVMDPSKFDEYGKPVTGAKLASISLDVAGPGVLEKAQVGGNMYEIKG